MIQQAHIGIGISGQEGMQAVMNSDYAIAQFRFLTRLLLVNGRLDYKRMSKLILYSFYKNMVFSLTQFFYNWFTGFSAATMYDGWSITIFNVVFTGLPVIIYAIFEQDISHKLLIKFPPLYETGQKSQEFSFRLLFYWLGTGVYQAFMIFFGAYLLWTNGVIAQAGHSDGVMTFGALCYWSVILTVNARLALEVRYWTWVTAFFVIACAFIWLCWMALIGAFPYFLTDGSMFAIAGNLFNLPTFWVAVAFLVILAIFPVVAVEYLLRNYRPRNAHIIQEIARMERKRGISEDIEMPMLLNLADDRHSKGNHSMSPTAVRRSSSDKRDGKFGYTLEEEEHTEDLKNNSRNNKTPRTTSKNAI